MKRSRETDELLSLEELENVPEGRVYGKRYRLEYRHRRPQSALGYQTPPEFATSFAASGSVTLSTQPHIRCSALNPLPDSQTVLS